MQVNSKSWHNDVSKQTGVNEQKGPTKTYYLVEIINERVSDFRARTSRRPQPHTRPGDHAQVLEGQVVASHMQQNSGNLSLFPTVMQGLPMSLVDQAH